MNLSKAYKYLETEKAPKILVEALKLLGVVELAGSKNSNTILAWAKDVNLGNVYTQDSIPWCGLFIAYVVKQAGYSPVASPLWASNWSFFGKGVDEPMLGDIIVFSRDGGGHVAIYVGEDNSTYHVLGGNQSDAVTITRIAKSRAKAFRRPRFLLGQPKNVRKIFLGLTGPISTNEQ